VRRRWILLGTLASLGLIGCGGGTPVASPTTPPTPATRVEVTLTDAMRIEPATMVVAAGTPVTFVVTNTGVIDHEFFVGDEAAQAEHDAEMAGGGMMHDHGDGISLEPGVTKELTITLDAIGTTLAGCHVPGHFAAGMKATITISG
jgi:uncharacterized cupredoxin-like copper-binding protein